MRRHHRHRRPGELLYEFVKGHTRIRFELVDRGKHGIEARILYNEEHRISQVFAPWHFSMPREAAVHWAEAERKAIEQDIHEDCR